MAIDRLLTDLNYHQSLPNQPKSEEGYTPEVLKALFDKAPNDIKDYINNVLIPALESTADGESGADQIGATAISDLSGTTVQAILESLRNKLKSTEDGASGADFINATAISGLSGTTVQSLLEALKTHIDTNITNNINALVAHKTSADHDGRYYTETEVNSLINTHKTSADHDNRYYTKTDMQSTTTGNSGASKIKISAVSEITSDNVQGAIEQTNARITQAVLGQVPDGSLTDAKLSNAAGQIKDRVTKIEAQISEPAYVEQEETTEIFSLATEGQISDYQICGNTRQNLVKSSNMDTDSNGDGIVDGFVNSSGTTLTYTMLLDTTKKAQNITVTSSSAASIYAGVVQTITGIIPGKPYTISVDFEISNIIGKFRGEIVGLWLNSSGNPIGTTLTKHSTTNERAAIINQIAPENAVKLEVHLRARCMAAGDTGAVWYKNLMVEQTDILDSYISSGVNSTEPVCITSIGKNLFDGEFETGTYEISTGLPIANANYIRNKNKYIRVEPSTSYRFSERNQELKNITAWIYDINKNFISVAYPWTQNALQIPTNGYYVNFAVNDTNINLELQLEKGNVATAYEPYKVSEAYTPADVTLRNLPNGVKDVFNVTKGLLTQNTKEYTLQVSDIYQYYTGYTNVDAVLIKKPSDYKYYGIYSGVVAGTILYNNYKEVVKSFNLLDSTEFIGTISAATADVYFYLIVAKGTYANLAAAQAALAGTTLIYQLAKPITKYYFPQNLNGKTVIVTNRFAYFGFYDATYGLVNLTNIPIKSLHRVLLVDKKTGAETEIDLSTCTVAADGMSFTSSALKDGDLVWYVANYDPSISTVPSSKVTVANNIKAVTETTAQGVINLNKRINNIDTRLKQVRNIIISTESPTAADGQDGDIWLRYE